MAKSKSVFLDADAVIALNTNKHPNKFKAQSITQKIKELKLEIFTCTYVLLEVATVMNMHYKGRRGAAVVTRILTHPGIKVIKGDSYLYEGIWELSQQKSKNVSLNDCVYFAIVRKLKIDTVFSFDRHWKTNGFRLLGAD